MLYIESHSTKEFKERLQAIVARNKFISPTLTVIIAAFHQTSYNAFLYSTQNSTQMTAYNTRWRVNINETWRLCCDETGRQAFRKLNTIIYVIRTNDKRQLKD